MPSVASMTDQGYGPYPGGITPAGPGDEQNGIAYIPPGFAEKYKEPFIYNVVANPLPASSGVVQFSTNVQNDSWFVCTAQTVNIVDAATQTTTFIAPNVAGILVRVADSSSGKFMVDSQTHIGNWFGTALQPFVWLWRARLYRPGGQIQVELQNLIAVAQTVRMSFIGFKCYNVLDSAAQM